MSRKPNIQFVKSKRASIISLVFIICTFLLVMSLFVFIGLTPLRILSQQTNLEKNATQIRQNIEQSSFSGSNNVLNTLQNTYDVKQALLNQDNCDKIFVVCNLAKDILNASLVYLMDTTGTVIASTNYLNSEGVKQNLTDNNYAFRPYFLEALKGNLIVYPAVGVTTGKRGIYCSAPVYDDLTKDVIGVIVIKLDVAHIDSDFRNYSQKIALLSPEKIVFSTNVDPWLFGVPRNDFDSIKANLKASKQFNEQTIVKLPFVLSKNRIIINDTTYLVEKQNLSSSDWILLVFEKKDPESLLNTNLLKIIFGIVLIFIFLSAIIFTLLYILRRKRVVELELKSNKENLRIILNSIGDGVIAVDMNGYVFQMNHVATKLTGFEVAEAAGKLISEVFNVFHSSSRKPYLEIVNAIQDGKIDTINELVLVSRHKTEYEISMLVTAIKDNQDVVLGMVLVFRDITQQKETKLKLKKQYAQIKEALRRANESDRLKTAFLQNMSHEIRTPLNGIVGFSELLSETELKEETIYEYRKHIVSNANYLLEIIHDVIEISKLETEQVGKVIIEFDLNEVCKDILTRYQVAHKNKAKIELRLQLPEVDNAFIINNDMKKITKLFYILLDNAYKFTYSGIITFGYVIDKNHIQCFVKDTGIGISEELHDEIFKNFTQILESQDKVSKGVGIGLAIAQKYALLLGGSIWLESEKKEGSTFYFSFPI